MGKSEGEGNAIFFVDEPSVIRKSIFAEKVAAKRNRELQIRRVELEFDIDAALVRRPEGFRKKLVDKRGHYFFVDEHCPFFVVTLECELEFLPLRKFVEVVELVVYQPERHLFPDIEFLDSGFGIDTLGQLLRHFQNVFGLFLDVLQLTYHPDVVGPRNQFRKRGENVRQLGPQFMGNSQVAASRIERRLLILFSAADGINITSK